MIPIQLDLAKHVIYDTGISRYLKNHLDERFFTYRHRDSGNWVVSFWLDRTKGILLELILLNRLADFTQRDAWDVAQWYHKKLPEPHELVNQIRSWERAHLRRDEDDRREALRLKRFLGKRSGPVHEDNPYWKTPSFIYI